MAHVSLMQKKKNLNLGAGKMAQSVKKLADKTDVRGPILRHNMTEGEN